MDDYIKQVREKVGRALTLVEYTYAAECYDHGLSVEFCASVILDS